MRRRTVFTLTALLALLLPAFASAARRPKEKYFVKIVGVETTKSMPAGLSDRAQKILTELLGKRKEFVPDLAGAPDPVSAPDPFKKWLKKKKLRAFNVVIKFTAVELEVLPADPGKTGQVLKAHIALQIFGTGMPDESMAMAGDGSSTVKLEIGAKVRPRDEENVYGDALNGALTSAVDDALRKLAAGPPSKPAKR